MRGGETRMRLLKSLETPKDRFQLAKDLGLDWKTIDSHVQRLLRYGMIREKIAYGTVKIYDPTATGTNVLLLMNGHAEGTDPREQEQLKLVG
jgi:predicted transcriptional regulator